MSGIGDIADRIEKAVERLANTRLGVSLMDWDRLSNDILAGAAEIRLLRTENEELKKKVALLKSDKRDLIEEIDGPVTESW